MASNNGTALIIAAAAVAAFGLSRIGSTNKVDARQDAKSENIEIRQDSKTDRVIAQEERKEAVVEDRQDGRTQRTIIRQSEKTARVVARQNKGDDGPIIKPVPQSQTPLFTAVQKITPFTTKATSYAISSAKDDRIEARQQAVNNVRGIVTKALSVFQPLKLVSNFLTRNK